MALRRAITGKIVNQSMAAGARSMSSWWRNVDSASKDSNIGLAGAIFSDPSPNIFGVGKETERRTAGNLNTVLINWRFQNDTAVIFIDNQGRNHRRQGWAAAPSRESTSVGGSMNMTDERRNVAIQALSGTGACRPLADSHTWFSPDSPISVVRANENQAVAAKSGLQQLVRPIFRNPSFHGPLIGSTLLGTSFSVANIRTSHSKAGVTMGNGEFLAKTTLRPLSPHLTVYKPQSSSTTSIFHRIAYIYMASAALFYYLLYLKIGMISFTYEGFYKFFYYTSELFPIINEISVVALAYYLYKGAEQFMKYR